MRTFPLRIVTPDGLFYDGPAEKLTLRTAAGELGILAGHTDLVTALGMGAASVTVDGQKRMAACIGGLLNVSRGSVTVVATTFEWQEDIDLPRAQRSAQRAQEVLRDKAAHTDEEIALAEARLKRALVRTGVKA